VSISTYKRWMKESYLYEAEDIDDKVVGTREKEDGEKVKVTVKQAMDYSGEDKDMLALKDKAKDLKTKDKGGEEKPKAEPKKTAISKTGGLGGEPEDKPFREPSVEKSVSRKGVDKVISGTKAFSDKDTQETFDNIVNDENQRGRDIIDYGNMKAPLSVRQHDNLVNGKRTAHLVKSSDPADKLKLLKIVSRMVKKNEEPKEKRPGGKEESIKVINGKKYRAIKESVDKRITVKEIKSWLKGLEEYRYRKIPGVDARRVASFINNGLNETDLPISLQKKWEHAKYSKEKGLADRFIKQRISQKLTQTESKHPIKEQYDRLFTDRVVL